LTINVKRDLRSENHPKPLLVIFNCNNLNIPQGPSKTSNFYSPFCVQAKIIKLIGLKNGGRLSPINLVTFAGPQNGELKISPCQNQ
jgi:hypothetical protein